MSHVVANTEDRFSPDEAHIIHEYAGILLIYSLCTDLQKY